MDNQKFGLLKPSLTLFKRRANISHTPVYQQLTCNEYTWYYISIDFAITVGIFVFFAWQSNSGLLRHIWLWLTFTKSIQKDQYRVILWYIPGWWWDIRLGEHYIKNILFGLKCYFIKILFESPLSSLCLPWTYTRERILPEYRQYVQPFSIHNTTVITQAAVQWPISI